MSHNFQKERFYFAVAVLMALIALTLYILFGRPDLEQGRRELENSDPSVQSVKVTDAEQGQSTIEVVCADGSSYEIYYPPGETNFEALRASKCSSVE